MSLNSRPESHIILIADDEPDIASVTQLGLKGLKIGGKPVEFQSTHSGEETVDRMRSNPDIAVILLDVVMESDTAGLDACRAIREELGNHLVRILLRTGQPGKAPEKETIEQHDIDGYLPKAELSSNRLYAAVRSAIRTWQELVELDRHRRYLTALQRGMASLHAFDPLEPTLERILETSLDICPTGLAVLHLETFAHKGDPRTCSIELSTDSDPDRAELQAAGIRARFSRDAARIDHMTEPAAVDDGYLIPLILPRDLGHGWIFLDGAEPDELAAQILPMLAANASNALYSVVAQEMLTEQQSEDVFESMIL